LVKVLVEVDVFERSKVLGLTSYIQLSSLRRATNVINAKAEYLDGTCSCRLEINNFKGDSKSTILL